MIQAIPADCKGVESGVSLDPLKTAITLFLMLLSPAMAAPGRTPMPGEILRTLKRTHPRMLLDSGKIEGFRNLVKQDEVAKAIYRKLKADADKTLRLRHPDLPLKAIDLGALARKTIDPVQSFYHAAGIVQ
jgi:hypothetical protein